MSFHVTSVTSERIFVEPEQDIKELNIDELIWEFKSIYLARGCSEVAKRLHRIKERIQEIKEKQLQEIV